MGAVWNDLTGNGPKPPPATDPNAQNERSQAGVGANIQQQETANRLDQTNAFGGTSRYYQTGVDANGNPIFAQSTSWGQPTQDFNSGLMGLGGQYISRANNMLDHPTDLSSMPAFQQAQDYATSTLGRQQQIQHDALDTQLKNQGLQPGTTAYDNAMRSQTAGFGDAMMNAINPIQQQLFNQNLQGAQFGTQQLTQLANPGLQAGFAGMGAGFSNVPGIGVQFIDPAAAYNNTFNQQQQNYKTQADELAGEYGAIGQIGGAAAKYMTSDERVKRDIKKVGELDGGLPVYSYRYAGQPQTQIGVMAQEAEKVVPEAVAEFGGVKHVDYKKLVDTLAE